MNTSATTDLTRHGELPWGRSYAMVEPSQFRVDYAINPFMDTAVQPDPTRATAQWHRLVATLRRCGAEVRAIEARPDSPDMVYAMNLGLPVVRRGADGAGEPTVLLSHMRYPERQQETGSAEAWFAQHDHRAVRIGGDGAGPHFEAGDAFAWRGELVVGFGPRTEAAALPLLAAELDVRVRGVRITHPGMYHLDLAFCPSTTVARWSARTPSTPSPRRRCWR
ncbi:dimethylarginine dimethylaminohydrolase family protein [Nocardioides sambongensis]|uniref:dimethylarginine dimethylaminohydrolase family protein n=1 Tax=Nocardioides sambongensis TaxID=2589074 RepID=UPI001E2B6FD7|nr:hypothetical protein [Nocardioides sambongensis]